MLAYRSFVVGILAAIAMFLAALPGQIALQVGRAAAPPPAPPRAWIATAPADAPAIAYVRPELVSWHADLGALVDRVVRLEPGEVISSMDGVPGPGRYLDVRLDGPRGPRTVLLLFTR